MKDSIHGIHIHQYGDISDRDSGVTLGSHWNPEGKTHGLPPSRNRHAGDLGDIQTYDRDGVAWYQLDNELIPSLSSLAGHGMVVHATFDHGDGINCDQAGNSGSRYATCVIGVVADSFVIPSPPISINNDFSFADCPVPSPTSTPNPFGEGNSATTQSFAAALLVCCILFAF